MKFSEAWLRQWVNPALERDALLQQLTMAGLEVDGVEPAAKEFAWCSRWPHRNCGAASGRR
jgi:phenylalanyl-tRNA synthetase beta chain